MPDATSDTPTALRVTMVSPHLPPAQAANAILPVTLGNALGSRQVTTRYLAHPSPAGPPPHDADATLVSGRGRGGLGRSLPGAVVAGLRMLATAASPIRGCDLVHFHGNGLLVETAQLLARLHARPYVMTLYGTDIWHHDEVRHARFGRVVRQAAARVFYSEELRAFARAKLLAPEPSLVIHAPVPAAFHVPERDERDRARRELNLGSGPVLLTVKRLHPVGGHEDLLHAMPRIIESVPGVTLLLVGEGELRPSLERETEALGIAPRVRFLGSIPNADLWRVYAAADVFVLPSRLESWGTVMLESLACGTPVVATATAGGREVHGYFPDDVGLTPEGDPAALAVAVTRALETPRRCAESTRARLADEFSVDVCAGRYLEVYRHAVAGPAVLRVGRYGP
jgi:glycosyltransferase involved in cell wall biosynthesis